MGRVCAVCDVAGSSHSNLFMRTAAEYGPGKAKSSAAPAWLPWHCVVRVVMLPSDEVSPNPRRWNQDCSAAHAHGCHGNGELATGSSPWLIQSSVAILNRSQHTLSSYALMPHSLRTSKRVRVRVSGHYTPLPERRLRPCACVKIPLPHGPGSCGMRERSAAISEKPLASAWAVEAGSAGPSMGQGQIS